MSARSKRTIIYLAAELHRALKLKAAAEDRSISDIVRDAVQMSLAEHADDLAAFATRASDDSLEFEGVAKALRRRRAP